jgi:hypothetical protein
MILQRINWCLNFYQGKCPHLNTMKRIYLFPQILNAIDTELAEANCLDCQKYIDRRALPRKSALEGKAPMKRGTTKASEIEKGQHLRIVFKLPASTVTSRSVIWKADRRI